MSEENKTEVGVKTLPAMSVMCIEHKGSYNNLEPVFDELITWIMREGHPYNGYPFAVLYDDSRDVAEEELRSDICVQMDEACEGKGRVIRRESPPLSVAYALHKGPYDESREVYEAIFAYIRENGYEYQDAFGVRELYLKTAAEVDEADLLTEIQIPITKASSEE